MAVSKNTTTKSTKAKETPVETVEVVEAVEEVKTVEEKVAPVRPKKRTEISRDDLIECRSSRKNLVYISKRTGDKFEWAEYGDIQDITFGELITMKSTQPRFLKEGWVIVDDEEAIEQLGLTTMYGNIFEIKDMDSFFASDVQEIQRILSNMPRGFKNSIATFAREHVESGKLDSNRKIKLLEQLLDVDLKIFE